MIALPYRFSFRHWSVSIGLVREQTALLQAIDAEAQRLGYEAEIYQQDPCSEQRNYCWVGHSLGTKYIALLELLSDLEDQEHQGGLEDWVDPTGSSPRAPSKVGRG